jgi:hypothetical protein
VKTCNTYTMHIEMLEIRNYHCNLRDIMYFKPDMVFIACVAVHEVGLNVKSRVN